MKAIQLFILTLLLGCAGAKYDRGVVPFAEANRDVQMRQFPFEGEQVTMVVGVRAGSAHDPVGQEGLAWLTAQHLKNGGGLGDRIADLGGRISVDVEDELVFFKLEIAGSKSASAVQVLVEAFTEPVYSADGLDRLQAEGLQWLDEGLGSSEARLAEAAFQQWVYQGHPYGHASQGRSGVLGTLDIDDIKHFFERRYIRPAIAVAHTGNLPEEAANAVRSGLSQRPATLYSDVTPRPIAPVNDTQVMAVLKEGMAPGVLLGHPVNVQVGEVDWAALILGRAAIEPSATLDRLMGSGLIQKSVSLWFSADNSQSAESLVSDAVAGVSRWVDQGIDPQTFEDTRGRLLSAIKKERSVPASNLRKSVEGVLLKHPDALSSLEQKLRVLTLEQVNSVLAERVDPGALRVVVLANRWSTEADSAKPIGTTHVVQAEGLFQ